MAEERKPWYRRIPARWVVFRSIPMSRLWILLLAGFFLFSTAGFYSDLKHKGIDPYAIVIFIAAFSGANACLWIFAFARLPVAALLAIVLLQFIDGPIVSAVTRWMRVEFALQPVASDAGIAFAGAAMFWASILSYVFFLRYIVGEGKRSIRIQGELELAHEIQRTLVPVIELRTPRFEIYGFSQPSERVGGDLVDAVPLEDGSIIAYLADITGHGLAASIFMGRVKTAIRTALLDPAHCEPMETLPQLLGRLNTVLPQVKEPHLYVTFSGFRLGLDGSISCALAASPPVLQWHAGSRAISQSQKPQLPVGLLPVERFDSHALQATPGDVLIVATDGILEVTGGSTDEEFGIERLQAIVAEASDAPLPDMAQRILSTALAFGAQCDDQTLLLIRCL